MVTPRRRSRRVQKAEEVKRTTALISPIKKSVRTVKRKVTKKVAEDSKSLPRIRLKSMVGRKRKIREDDEVPNINPKRPKQKSSSTRKRSVKKVEEEVLPEGHFEIMEIGPLYLSWISYQEGDKKKYAIGDEKDHLIWVKWMTPENKSGEWAAESQSIFETPEQIAIIDEIKAKQEIWPWVEDEGDGTIELRKSLLKQGGYKEYLHKNDRKLMEQGVPERDVWSIECRQKVKESEKPNNNDESSEEEDDDDEESSV